MTKLLVVVSDLHAGSVVGLAPPSTQTESGNVIGFGSNFHQEWLWEKWVSAREQVLDIIGKDKADLLVNGDATEGVHHRNEASLIAALIETHVNMAVDCLTPLQKICGGSVFIVKGTECHTLEMESLLAQKLGAVSGKAKDKWLIRMNGCLIDAAHHMPTTGRAYLEASAMSIMMGNARMNYIRAKHEVPDVFLRGHRHCGGYYSDGSGLYGVTGAFQMLTRHGMKVVTDSIPRPSVLVLDWRDKKHGELPAVHDIRFNPPQAEIYEA